MAASTKSGKRAQVEEGMAPASKRVRRQAPMLMRLHLLKGKFFTVGAVQGRGGAEILEEAVWSRLPDDLIWRVLQFVPAAQHFHLQLVSTKWRQVLTSANFRRAVAAALAGDVEEQRPGVVACVTDNKDYECDGGSFSSNSKVKLVDIDLSSFVPSWFWKSESFRVVAAADGLVCICNEDQYCCSFEPRDEQYCVINPLTRTWKVLPKVPFRPLRWHPSSGRLAISGRRTDDAGICHWTVATYDLEGAADQWTLSDNLLPRRLRHLRLQSGGTLEIPEPVVFAVCNGETFFYCVAQRRMYLRSAVEGVQTTVTFDGPKFLDLDWLQPTPMLANENEHPVVELVAHRGSLFFIGLLNRDARCHVFYGVWRLVRSGMTWEAVTGLETKFIDRLAGLPESDGHDSLRYALHASRGAGDLLYFDYSSYSVKDRKWTEMRFKVGFSLEMGTWELLHRNEGCPNSTEVLELRPDAFLF